MMHSRIPSIQINGLPQAYRDSRLFLVACEGEKTEAKYFSFSFLLHSRVKIIVIPSSDGESAPSHVLDNLKALVKEAKRDLGLQPSDRLWLVIDRDRWNLYTQILPVRNARIDGSKINIAISNPSFVLFLYLHFADMPQSAISSAEEMEGMLRSILGRYSKNDLHEEDYADKVQAACGRSLKTAYDSAGIPVNPGTDAGKLILEIQECRTRR